VDAGGKVQSKSSFTYNEVALNFQVVENHGMRWPKVIHTGKIESI